MYTITKQYINYKISTGCLGRRRMRLDAGHVFSMRSVILTAGLQLFSYSRVVLTAVLQLHSYSYCRFTAIISFSLQF